MAAVAFYFGCWERPGHYLHDVDGRLMHRLPADCPWNIGLMDGGLLQNGKREDRPDGRVWWTVGGADLEAGFWHAFYWWTGPLIDVVPATRAST